MGEEMRMWFRDAWTVLTGMAAGGFVTQIQPYTTASEHAPKWLLIGAAVVTSTTCYERVRRARTQAQSSTSTKGEG